MLPSSRHRVKICPLGGAAGVTYGPIFVEWVRCISPYYQWPEWPLSQISRSRYYWTTNNSKIVQDRAIVTVPLQLSLGARGEDVSGGAAYTLHKPRRIHFPRRKTYAKGIADFYQIDLADVSCFLVFLVIFLPLLSSKRNASMRLVIYSSTAE